jgi:hypothetical protein
MRAARLRAAPLAWADDGRACPFCEHPLARVEAAAPFAEHWICRFCSGAVHVRPDGAATASHREDGARRTYAFVDGALFSSAGIPVTRPGHPVEPPASSPSGTIARAPVARPADGPLGRPSRPVETPAAPVERPGRPVEPPGHAVPVPGHSVTVPSHAVNLPGLAVTRPGHPVTRPGHPITRPGNPVAAPIAPAAPATPPCRTASA